VHDKHCLVSTDRQSAAAAAAADGDSDSDDGDDDETETLTSLTSSRQPYTLCHSYDSH